MLKTDIKDWLVWEFAKTDDKEVSLVLPSGVYRYDGKKFTHEHPIIETKTYPQHAVTEF